MSPTSLRGKDFRFLLTTRGVLHQERLVNSEDTTQVFPACFAEGSWIIGDPERVKDTVMGFLELRQARGVYSRVTTGMPILNGSLFSEVRTLV